jgi:hypothetical protein
MKLKAAELGGGAMLERIQSAIQQIVMDICDINTEAKAKRQIVVKITFAPNEERNGASHTIDVKTKLGGPKIVDGVIRFGINGRTGEVDALEIFQQSLFPEPELPEGVADLDGAREQKESESS